MVSQVQKIQPDNGTSKESILDSATEVFMELGFSGARVDAIARRAGANKAMIYYHFGSKQRLYQAVLLRLFGGVLEDVDHLKSTDLGPEARLRDLYTRIARRFTERPALPQIMLREVLAGGKGMDTEVSRTLTQILGFVSETVRQGVVIEDFRPVHPLLLHMSVLGPLLLFFAGASFRERVLQPHQRAEMHLTHEDMLAYLLENLGRSLRPGTREPSVKST